MDATNEMPEVSTHKKFCTVLVLYEDVTTRQRGLAACDYLVQKFWTEVDFTFHWWRTDFLADAALAAAAAAAASQANLIFLCSVATQEPSTTLRAWFDSWIESRLESEGLLVNLLTGEAPTHHRQVGELFLREISRRADLDYLGTFPQTSTGTFAASAMDAEHRANQMSAALKELQRESPRPPRFGIND
jgi:hypothetical protein